MLKVAGTAVAGMTLLGPRAFARNDEESAAAAKMPKVLIIGAHPDDPETCCGGTILKLKEAGYEVVVVYMTRGQSGIRGKSHEEAGAIRTQEAIDACQVMGVRPVFMSQVDGYSEINVERYDEMREIIVHENPDIVFTHWTLDLHRDHRVCSCLVLEAWKRLKYKFELYFFEPMTGAQAQLFHPTDYVDITSVADKKREACNCHESQGMDHIYDSWHEHMERFRGIEFHCQKAEGFVHLRRTGSDILFLPHGTLNDSMKLVSG